MKISSFKYLIVWQKSMQLAVEVYKTSQSLPKSELYGLTNQLRRAAISIPSNIAEGRNRNHKSEFIQFLGIASGSAAELETQIILSKRIYNTDFSAAKSLLVEVQKMLWSMLSKLR